MVGLGEMFGARPVSTFMGVPECRDLSRLDASVVILGAGCATAYPRVGAYCRGGPAAIRRAAADYAASADKVNFDLGGVGWPSGAVVDAGDLPQDEADAPGNRARIFGAVGQVLDKGAVPVVIGGDDSVTIPAIEAFGARGKFTIVQIDAHIDWREQVAGERLGLSSVMRRASEMNHIERIIQVGQRGLGSAGSAEFEAAKAWGVTMVPGGEVAARGVGRAVDAVPAGSDVILCLDFDGLDPSIMPAVIGRTAGGLGYWQCLELVGGIMEKARIAGLTATEFMEDRDIDGLGAATAAQLLTSMMGLFWRQASAG